MASIKVHAGDFPQGSAAFNGSLITFASRENPGLGDNYTPSQIEEIAVASEEAVKRIGGTLGWGAVGALALGPVGLLAGLLLGGKGKEVTFAARFIDGKKVLATTDSGTYAKLLAASFK